MPALFANGGERKKKNTPEREICQKFSIETVLGAGAGKVPSSLWLVRKVKGGQRSDMQQCQHVFFDSDVTLTGSRTPITTLSIEPAEDGLKVAKSSVIHLQQPIDNIKRSPLEM